MTLQRTGSSTQSYYTPNDYNWYKTQGKGTISGTSHTASWVTTISRPAWTTSKAGRIISPEHTNGDYQQLFRSGAPFEVSVFNFPINVRNDDRYYATFVEDAWRTAGDRLTLNLGARFAFDHGFVPARTHAAGQFADLYPAASYPQVNVTSWNTFAPRLHATYALTKDVSL